MIVRAPTVPALSHVNTEKTVNLDTVKKGEMEGKSVRATIVQKTIFVLNSHSFSLLLLLGNQKPMRLFLHLAVLILLGGFGNAQRHPRYCAGLSEENPVEPHRRCRIACNEYMDCGYGYCRFFGDNPQPRCWCMECKKNRRRSYD
ncbi:unnamed protein product [Cylicocyclus nassatus]|uniref:Uncharacterized protein n=1 Tax=Cylicocyclus nassatus TaxID=53992 RepID=A0AA36HD11_CYLNA|nr:unnamed protein product [Cylicocyclus nassatus]